jgi:hypothetical protein
MPEPPGTKWLRSQKPRLKFTPEEMFLYNHHIRNLQAGGVPNQGGLSTIFNITAEFGGKHFVLPTVWDNQIIPPEAAIARAREVGLEKFPSYKSEKEAKRRYNELHLFMSKDMEFQ